MAQLTVELYGEEVGALLGERGDFTFTVHPEALERHGLGSTRLSVAVPFFERGRRRDEARERNFFEELLSEGSVREQLASNARVDSSNTIALLARYGRDVAGAVQIWDAHDPAEPRTPEARPVTGAEITTMFDEVRQNPLGNKGRRRLSSLAGVQDKVLLARVGQTWAEPLDGYPSTHLLKPQSGKYLSLIFDEEYGSRFARGLGLAAFETRVSSFGGRSALVVERYDRDEHGNRLHQEDFNQALGNRGDGKYETLPGDDRLKAIARVLREHASMTENRKLAAMLTLSLAVGNLDMHAKNISLTHDALGVIRLAPMYDVVPQLHLDVDPEFALLVNGKSDFFDIDGGDLLAEISSWGLREARRYIAEVLERVLEIVAIEHPLPGADPSLTGVITARARHLLETLPLTTATARRSRRKQGTTPEVFESRTAPGGWGGPVR